MSSADLAAFLEAFFTGRLITQRRVSPHTVASYRDTFRLLLQFAQKELGKSPSKLAIPDLNAALIGAFLDTLERNRANASRSRNVRLTAIRSFFRYLALECPEHSVAIQRVLAIPPKRQSSRLVDFLTRPEIEALLAVRANTADPDPFAPDCFDKKLALCGTPGNGTMACSQTWACSATATAAIPTRSIHED